MAGCASMRGAFIFLSSDASPQGGSDFLLTLEDHIAKCHAGAVIDSTASELAQWNAAGHLKTCSLPVAVVGLATVALLASMKAYCAALFAILETRQVQITLCIHDV